MIPTMSCLSESGGKTGSLLKIFLKLLCNICLFLYRSLFQPHIVSEIFPIDCKVVFLMLDTSMRGQMNCAQQIKCRGCGVLAEYMHGCLM